MIHNIYINKVIGFTTSISEDITGCPKRNLSYGEGDIFVILRGDHINRQASFE